MILQTFAFLPTIISHQILNRKYFIKQFLKSYVLGLIIEKTFNLFSNCKIVKGKTRGILLDLQRNDLYPIPLSLCTILEYSGKKTIQNLIDEYGMEEEETIMEYFNFLVDKDLVFFHDHPEYFPPLNDQWDEPFEITNSIIDFQEVKKTQLEDIINCIGDLPIKSVQLRIFCEASIEKLNQILDAVKPRGINSIEILMKYNPSISSQELFQLTDDFPYISTMTIFGSPKEDVIQNKNIIFGQIFFVVEKAFSEKDCGVIKPAFFTVNTKTYTESLNHNSCLNRKISIDSNGYIKNCPSLPKSYGHISNTTFNSAIASKDFKSLWNINKDKTHICKDCEFRYVCTDCRAYVEDPEDIFSKPLKCGYNPYTGKWSNWEENSEKKKLIEHYNFNYDLENN